MRNSRPSAEVASTGVSSVHIADASADSSSSFAAVSASTSVDPADRSSLRLQVDGNHQLQFVDESESPACESAVYFAIGDALSPGINMKRSLASCTVAVLFWRWKAGGPS